MAKPMEAMWDLMVSNHAPLPLTLLALPAGHTSLAWLRQRVVWTKLAASRLVWCLHGRPSCPLLAAVHVFQLT